MVGKRWEIATGGREGGEGGVDRGAQKLPSLSLFCPLN